MQMLSSVQNPEFSTYRGGGERMRQKSLLALFYNQSEIKENTKYIYEK